MNRISILILSLLLTACGCRYNGIDTREVLVSPSAAHASHDPNDASIDVTDERINYVR
jgi:hypothetical protein